MTESGHLFSPSGGVCGWQLSQRPADGVSQWTGQTADGERAQRCSAAHLRQQTGETFDKSLFELEILSRGTFIQTHLINVPYMHTVCKENILIINCWWHKDFFLNNPETFILIIFDLDF